jgi:hypothetical protein
MRSEACGCPKVRFADLQTPAGGPRDLVLRVTMTRASNEVGARSRRECRTTASTGPGRKIATVERREAGVSLRWKRWASKARRPRAGHGTHYRVLAAPGRLSALRHPLIGVATEEANSEPGVANREKRGREKKEKRERSEDESRDGRRGFLFAIRYSPLTSGLFDIVIMTAARGTPVPARAALRRRSIIRPSPPRL